MVEMLLDANADPNAQDKEKRTPLHLAAEGGHLGVVRPRLRRRHAARGPPSAALRLARARGRRDGGGGARGGRRGGPGGCARRGGAGVSGALPPGEGSEGVDPGRGRSAAPVVGRARGVAGIWGPPRGGRGGGVGM
ncbi:hypothetical protein LUU34_00129100 [Aix galericulata]|nr:hypothetical protein LUU34_00129100 [Aix galericulata]